MSLSAHSYPDEYDDKEEYKADYEICNQKLAFEYSPHHNYKSVDRNNLGLHSEIMQCDC